MTKPVKSNYTPPDFILLYEGCHITEDNTFRIDYNPADGKYYTGTNGQTLGVFDTYSAAKAQVLEIHKREIELWDRHIQEGKRAKERAKKKSKRTT